jgi:hypothetical protein
MTNAPGKPGQAERHGLAIRAGDRGRFLASLLVSIASLFERT